MLVNRAGLGLPLRASLPPAEDAAAVLDVNLVGPWRVTGAALPALRASGGGRVVNVATGLAHLAVPLDPAYCMSSPASSPTPTRCGSRSATRPRSRRSTSLDGLVPEEPLDVVAAVVRAAVGPYARDVATTRQAAVSSFFARRSPRRVLDRLTLLPVRRRARSGRLDGSSLAAELVAALKR